MDSANGFGTEETRPELVEISNNSRFFTNATDPEEIDEEELDGMQTKYSVGGLPEPVFDPNKWFLQFTIHEYQWIVLKPIDPNQGILELRSPGGMGFPSTSSFYQSGRKMLIHSTCRLIYNKQTKTIEKQDSATRLLLARDWEQAVVENWKQLRPLKTRWNRPIVEQEGRITRTRVDYQGNDQKGDGEVHLDGYRCGYMFGGEGVFPELWNDLVRGCFEPILVHVPPIQPSNSRSTLPKVDYSSYTARHSGFGLSLDQAHSLYQQLHIPIGQSPYTLFMETYVQMDADGWSIQLPAGGCESSTWAGKNTCPSFSKNEWTYEMMAHTWEREILSLYIHVPLLSPLIEIVKDYIVDTTLWIEAWNNRASQIKQKHIQGRS